MSERRWRRGDIVVLRYVETPTSARMVHAILGDPALTRGHAFLANGEVVSVQGRPYRVLEDSDDAVALFQPEGTVTRRWMLREGRYTSDPPVSQGDSLRLLFPGKPYDTTLFFEAEGEPPWLYDGLFEGEGLVAGWRERRRRGDAGFEPPGRPGSAGRFRGWYVNIQTPFRRRPFGFDFADMTLDIVVRPDRSWYWKDEDELAIAAGALSDAQVSAIRAAGEEVVALIESGSAPFDESWRRWLPLPREPLDSVPDGWQEPPGVQPDWPPR